MNFTKLAEAFAFRPAQAGLHQDLGTFLRKKNRST